MKPSQQRTLILITILLGLLIAGFFGMRALLALSRISRHPSPPLPPAEAGWTIETDVELIRDWMTVPFIAETYGVPPKFLFDALGIPPRGNEEKSLAQLNEEFSPQVPGIVMEVIKAAIVAKQSIPTEQSPPSRQPLPATP
jgi:hypothetical protein